MTRLSHPRFLNVVAVAGVGVEVAIDAGGAIGVGGAAASWARTDDVIGKISMKIAARQIMERVNQ